MPIRVIWDDEKHRAIRYDFDGEWSWNEFGERVREVYEMIATVEHRVDTIANFKDSRNLPGGAIQQVRQALMKAPPNTGNIIVAHGTMFVETIARTFGRVYRALGQRVYVVDSLEEAREIVAQDRSVE